MSKLLLSLNTLASDGASHSHGSGGEAEHLYPIIIVFAVLVVLGFGAGYFINKKK